MKIGGLIFSHMKKIVYVLLLGIAFAACDKDDKTSDNGGERDCGLGAAGQRLYTGSKGGCYYYNSNGNKTYVDRSECK